MDRREFLGKLLIAGAAAGSAGLLGGRGSLFAEETAKAGLYPDLVAVKNGKTEDMFDRALLTMGGLNRFFKRGAIVVVKPNIGWDRPPEANATTNPILVARIVQRCLEAGAAKVIVFDHTCDDANACYRTSMIEKYAKDAGAQVAPGGSKTYYQEVTIAGAKTLKKTFVHELILESDAWINVPVLKNHGGAGMTSAMKNLMGIVWNRDTFHSTGLDSCIADIALYRRPTLNVVDAFNVMLSQGPRGNAASTYRMEKMLIMSPDIVAIDAASAKVLGKEPSSFSYIGMGHDRNAGRQDIANLKIERITM